MYLGGLSRIHSRPAAVTARHAPFRRAAGRRRGSYFLEFSLTFWPLFVVMLGVIDFAIPIFIRSAFTNAVREGARFGITYRTVNGQNHTDSIKTVVMQNSCGFLTGSQGMAKVKVRFYSPSSFNEVTSGTRNADGNIIEVSIEEYTWNWIIPLWRTVAPLTFNIRAADRLETLPRGSTRPGTS